MIHILKMIDIMAKPKKAFSSGEGVAYATDEANLGPNVQRLDLLQALDTFF